MFNEKQTGLINKTLKMMESVMEDSALYAEGERFFNSIEETRTYCRLKIGFEEREMFMVLYLNNRHKLISADIIFKGTINACQASPREVIKAALKYNAAAIILAHNHPSGDTSPSKEDIAITKKIQQVSQLLDIRLLDHIIVSPEDTLSFVAKGIYSF